MVQWATIQNMSSGLVVALSSTDNGAALHLEVMVVMVMMVMVMMMMVMVMMVARRHIPAMTKSQHGGEI